MAQIIIDIPDAIATRVINGIALRNGWTTDSPFSQPQFVKRALILKLKNDLIDYESVVASKNASAIAENSARQAGDQIT